MQLNEFNFCPAQLTDTYLLAKRCVVHCDIEFSHLEILALCALNGCIGSYDVDDKCGDTNYC